MLNISVNIKEIFGKNCFFTKVFSTPYCKIWRRGTLIWRYLILTFSQGLFDIKCSAPGRPHYLNTCPPPGRMLGNFNMTLIFLVAAISTSTSTSTSYLNGYRVFVYVDRLFTIPNQARRKFSEPKRDEVKDMPTYLYYIPTNTIIRMK